MKIYRKCLVTGEKTMMDLPVTIEQMRQYARGEGYIQDIFPNLSPTQREFILHGMLPETQYEMEKLMNEIHERDGIDGDRYDAMD